jgi:UDP-2,3-diacylglucosamine hydrolase
MATLFISDLHLEDSAPERTQWLIGLLEGRARQADALYILGDLFEFWIGDDSLSETAGQVAAGIASLNEAGVPCHFMHGNRDFLLGPRYAERAGLRLLPDPFPVNLHGIPTLLLHGDTLCTDDAEYQAFRRQTRDPEWQASVLAMSVEERLQLARSARDASRAHTGSVAMEIMDVNEAAVQAACREHGVRRMIHGHTHRPAVHRFELEGTEIERIVLADWYESGSYLEVSGEKARTVTL